ncbi:MAG: amidohydrolase family protein [Eubacterium sp.]|nr:amidohydrolase family protein [Eubacterium sp.]
MIIDFHVHTFPKAVADLAIHTIGYEKAGIRAFTDGTPEGLIDSMKKAGIAYSVNLPVPTNMKQMVKLNRLAVETREENLQKGIINFGGIHPQYEDYKSVMKDLAAHGVPGIKIHPAFMDTDIEDIRCLRVIDYACQLGLCVLLHTGIELSTHDHNYCTVEGILHVIHEVGPDKLILAHMGNLGFWDQVEKYLCGAPVWFDTAFSLGKICRDPKAPIKPFMDEKLRPEDFTRIARKHGTDRLLFGTDSPWGGQQEEVDMIRALDFTQEELEKIFSGNAKPLLLNALNN